MKPLVVVFLCGVLFVLSLEGRNSHIVVADSVSRQPLPGASVFNSHGTPLGITGNRGRLPYISPQSYPITLRYLGFEEKILGSQPVDTVFMKELTTELPEVVVESRLHKVLHILAYEREYSSLSTYTDTVFLFREKMVDYMITPDEKMKFRGWRTPRVLKSKSYYRFTNSMGIDSVSNRCNHHFSWSDWIGIVKPPEIPEPLKETGYAADTVMGKYSPTEIWLRNNDRITVDVNVLADTVSRKWVHNFSLFFKEYLDFENFRLRYNYGNVAEDSIASQDVSAYSFFIESNGRGRDMFRFNKKDEPFFVSTFGEVYILDKEFITVKEAKEWSKREFDKFDIGIIEPSEAPDLQPAIKQLVARVDAINHDGVRLDIAPDRRLIGRKAKKQHIGQRALTLLKDLTGITYFRSHRNINRNWNKFKKDWKGSRKNGEKTTMEEE